MVGSLNRTKTSIPGIPNHKPACRRRVSHNICGPWQSNWISIDTYTVLSQRSQRFVSTTTSASKFTYFPCVGNFDRDVEENLQLRERDEIGLTPNAPNAQHILSHHPPSPVSRLGPYRTLCRGGLSMRAACGFIRNQACLYLSASLVLIRVTHEPNSTTLHSQFPQAHWPRASLGRKSG